MNRKPRDYRGINHQTIGSDILSVVRALHAPEQALGPELARKLSAVKPNEWYPIAMILEALEVLDQKLDAFALRNVGWKLFEMSHAETAKKMASSARDVLFGFDQLYHNANRGIGIGGWKVATFKPRLAILEKTTPHHCVMEEGIIHEALRLMGCKVEVTQTECFRRGADLCIYSITTTTTGERWSGKTAAAPAP